MNYPTITQLRDEAVAYYELCERARTAGVPVSLDDSRTPQTIAALRERVDQAESQLQVAA